MAPTGAPWGVCAGWRHLEVLACVWPVQPVFGAGPAARNGIPFRAWRVAMRICRVTIWAATAQRQQQSEPPSARARPGALSYQRHVDHHSQGNLSRPPFFHGAARSRKKKERERDSTDLNPAPLPKPLKKSHAHADLPVAAVCAATRLTPVVLSQHEPVEMPYVCAPLHYTDVPHRMHAAFRAERPPWLAWQEPTRVEREWLSMGVGRAAASADQRAGGTRGQLGAADFCWWGAGAGRRASWARRRGPASALLRLSSARAGKRRRCSQWGAGAWPGDLAETMHTVEWGFYGNSLPVNAGD